MRRSGKPLVRDFQSVLILTMLLMSGMGAGASAQIPYHDPLPWYVPPDSTFSRYLDVSLDRFEDADTHWQGNRVGLTAEMRAGRRPLFYFRAYLLAFNTAALPALQRWPGIAGEEAEAGWPFETRMVGFANPELGLMAPFSLLLLGKTWLGLAVGLPIGKEKLYPMSSASFPLRAALKKDLTLFAPLHLNLVGGAVVDLDSSDEILDSDAFPDGFWLGASLVWLRGARGWLSLSVREESRQERRSTQVGLDWWIPLRFGHSFAVGIRRELRDTSQRPFQTQVTLTWRLQGPEGGEAQETPP